MTELSRRHILTGAAASVALAPFEAPSVHAAAPLSGKQAPNFYRSKLGDFEITVVSDGARAIPLPATFVRNISNEQVLAAAEAARRHTQTADNSPVRDAGTTLRHR